MGVDGHSHDIEQLLQMLMQNKTHNEGTDEVNTTYANKSNCRPVAKDPDASQGSHGFPGPACARVSLPLNGLRKAVVPFDPEPRSQTRRIERFSKIVVVACRQCIWIFDGMICRFVSVKKIHRNTWAAIWIPGNLEAGQTYLGSHSNTWVAIGIPGQPQEYLGGCRNTW